MSDERRDPHAPMDPELQVIFREIEPPPGGLSALRRRIRAERRPALWWIGPAALAAAALLIWIRTPGPEIAAPTPADDPAIQALWGEVSPGARGVERTVLMQVDAEGAVLIYRTSTLDLP